MTFYEKTIKSEKVYEGILINVRMEEVMAVNGKPAYREIVEHKGGVGLVAITDDGKIVMERQFRKTVDRDVLEIPAGKLEGDEDPLIAAKRELAEETGYRAENIEFLTKYYPSVGFCRECLTLYLCTGLTLGDTNPDEDEAIDIEYYTMDELCDMIDEGKIADGKTVAGILAAKLRLSKKQK